MNVPVWFIPSFFGDVRLRRTDTGCEIHAAELNEVERAGLRSFQVKAANLGWLPKKIGDLGLNGKYAVNASIDDVSRVLARHLKTHRKLVDLVIFEDGTVKDVTKTVDGGEEIADEPYRTASPPKAAATVAKPTQGCPAPDFDIADVRATEVLLTFLDPQQAADWSKHQSFITKGASGLRYAITSRHAAKKLKGTTFQPGFERTFYCLDDRQAFCVHDWVVPPAEEVLTMHLMAQTPHGERYLRHLE